MHCLLTLLVMVGLPPADDAGEATPAPPRTRAAWNREVSGALRRQAIAEDAQQPQRMMDLIALYHQLHADASLSTTDRSRLREKLRKRLWRLSRELSRDVELRTAKIKTVRRSARSEDRRDKLATIREDHRVLDRWRTVLSQAAPAGQGGPRGGAAATIPDYGDDLVELIQTVISPQSWDVHGGPMAVVYYRNLRVLVVSATTEVHEQVGGLAEAIRRVGN